MASEPNPKSEELLRAYAKKRREQAGAPFELHPATRNLLQAEVARQHGKPSERKASWLGNIILHWPRFALAGCVVAGAFVGVLIWSDAPKTKGKELQLALGKDGRLQQDLPTVQPPAREEKADETARKTWAAAAPQPQAGGARVDAPSQAVEALSDEFRSRSIAADADRARLSKLEAKSFGETDAQRKLAEAPPPASTPTSTLGAEARTLARSPVTTPPGATTPALRPAGPQPNDTLDRLGTSLSLKRKENEERLGRQPESPTKQLAASEDQVSLAKIPSVGEVAQTRAQDLYAFQNNSSRQRWVQAPIPAAKQPVRDAKLAAILNSFEVEQTGNALRITEPDGSSYEGQILDTPPAQPPAQQESKAARQLGSASRSANAGASTTSTPEREVLAGQNLAGVDGALSVQNVYFRAVGTNQSLNQRVVINGNFVVNSNPAFNNTVYFQNSPGLGNQQAGAAADAAGGIILPVDRLEGTALVGGAQEVLINATPQAAP